MQAVHVQAAANLLGSIAVARIIASGPNSLAGALSLEEAS
jgi:hypothetical protein